MRNFLLFFLVVIIPMAFIVLMTKNADQVALSDKEACVARGGFPISKGPRTYAYHCFKNDPGF